MKSSGRHFEFSNSAFSLVEVVLALGIVAFATLAILGVFPAGLSTSHAAQNETRATQIAQDILSSVASQASLSWPQTTIKQPQTTTAGDFSYNVKLDGSTPTYTFSADNDGHLVVPGGSPANYTYQVTVLIAPDPPGFAPGYASMVTVRVAWQPFATNIRNFVRIVSKN